MYTQKQARRDISTGFALDGNELYFKHTINLDEVLGNYKHVAMGHGKNGINCLLLDTENLGYAAFATRSSGLLYCL